MSLPTKILTAAMASSKQVFVQYSPHVSWLSVYAHPPEQQHCEGCERVYLMNETVYLDKDTSDEHLAIVLEKIEALG